jgi:ribosome recycling factor
MPTPLNSANNTDEIVTSTVHAMDNTVEAFQKQLDKLHAGRASPALLETIAVPQPQGGHVLLSHMATITVIDNKTLMVTLWDKTLLQAAQKAILGSTLGLNPALQGDALRVPLPTLSTQRRQDMVRMVNTMRENMCTEIRNHRHKANMQFKALEKDKVMSEDESRRGQSRVQTLTDEHVKQIKDLASEKEKQILS